MKLVLSAEDISNKIYVIRGHKVMLDRDLAELYGVPTKRLNEAVQRNIKRFPGDFMYLLTVEEVKDLRSQFATSNRRGRGGSRYRPYVFTEQGVAMLSSVLNSERAIEVNIAIMRTFVKFRKVLESNKKLSERFKELERKVGKHDHEISTIFEAIRQLIAQPEKPKRRIGFHAVKTNII